MFILALPDGGQTNLDPNIDNHIQAQTTLPVGEGGLSRMQSLNHVPVHSPGAIRRDVCDQGA